jgi:hypothetical protein
MKTRTCLSPIAGYIEVGKTEIVTSCFSVSTRAANEARVNINSVTQQHPTYSPFFGHFLIKKL